MYFEKSFNIVTTKLRTEFGPTDRLRKDTLCFHTFMLMNIVNMINCTVVDGQMTKESYKSLLVCKQFWFIFIIEMLV